MFDSLVKRIELEKLIAQYLGVGIRRWRWLLLGVGIASCIGAYRYINAPRIYEASSQVMLSTSMPQIMGRRVESVADPISGRWRDRKYEKTQHRLMEGIELSEAVSRYLRIHPEQLIKELETLKATNQATKTNPLAGASDSLSQRLEYLRLANVFSLDSLIQSLNQTRPGYPVRGTYSVIPQRDTNLIDIRVRHPDREWAQTLATAVAKVFVQFNLEQRRAATAEAASWLGQQVDVQRAKLEDAELQLQEYKKNKNIVSVSLRDRSNMTMDSLKAISNDLSRVVAQRVALEAKIEVLDGFDGDFSVLPEFKDGRLGAIQERLSKLREEFIDISTTYTDAHPRYQAIRNKLQLTEEELAQASKDEFRGVRGALDIALQTERRLQGEVKRLTLLSLELNGGQLDFERLQRDRTNAEQMYSIVLQRHKEAEMEQNLNINNASVVKEADLPGLPVSPVRRSYFLFTALAASFLGIALALIREFIDSTIKTHDSLVAFGQPFLGIFPRIDSVDAFERDLFVSNNSKSSAAECARTLRTNLLFMNPDSPPKFIGVSSASPQEGKSTIAIALATTMAQSGSKTLLIDADMRRPRLHKTFKRSKNLVGLSSLIIEEATLDEALEVDILPGLDLLCCGPIPPNPAELLHAPGFERLFEKLGKRYDRIIFDAPPLNPVSDPMVLATMVDGMVIVVASHQTRSPALSMALSRLKEVNATILGLVLNKVTLRAGRGYGYGQYSYQYQYYSTDYSDKASDESPEAA